jgi:hypothetical protein
MLCVMAHSVQVHADDDRLPDLCWYLLRFLGSDPSRRSEDPGLEPDNLPGDLIARFGEDLLQAAAMPESARRSREGWIAQKTFMKLRGNPDPALWDRKDGMAGRDALEALFSHFATQARKERKETPYDEPENLVDFPFVNVFIEGSIEVLRGDPFDRSVFFENAVAQMTHAFSRLPRDEKTLLALTPSAVYTKIAAPLLADEKSIVRGIEIAALALCANEEAPRRSAQTAVLNAIERGGRNINPVFLESVLKNITNFSGLHEDPEAARADRLYFALNDDRAQAIKKLFAEKSARQLVP